MMYFCYVARCDLRVVVEQVSTDSLAYLSGRAEDCPVKALDVDSLHTDVSIAIHVDGSLIHVNQ